MATLSRGDLLPQEIVTDLFNKVKGKSTLAAMCAARPIPFNGQKDYTFSMDKEVDVVAENGAKSAGGITIGTRTIVPVKVEYGARVSDEFMYGSEDVQLDILAAFNDGYAKKVARGLDFMAYFGINPRTGTAAAEIINDNHFMAKVTQSVEYDDSSPDANAAVEAAVALVNGSEYDVTGITMAPAFRSALAAQTFGNGQFMFPELGWGNTPGNIKGVPASVGVTLAKDNKLLSVVGDFAEGFRWGYSKQIPLKIIEYGCPDNDTSAGDLQGHNQVYLRCETYLGWAILVPEAFALIKPKAGD
nr:phage major capsid protein [uncultured Dysosmobacter sp.]